MKSKRPWVAKPAFYSIEVETSAGIEVLSVDSNLKEQIARAPTMGRVRGCPPLVRNTLTGKVVWPPKKVKSLAAGGGR